MDLLRVCLVILLVTLTGTDALIMGETTIDTQIVCKCSDQRAPITCPPTHRVLLLQAEYGFKFLATCSLLPLCVPACCEIASKDCFLPYSDNDIGDLQRSCAEQHTCDIKEKEGVRSCNENDDYTYSRVRSVCVNDTMGDVSRGKSVLADIVYVKLAGTDEFNSQKQYEKAVCVAESQTGKDVELTFLLPDYFPSASAAVKVGEDTLTLATRNTTGRVASPATITFVEGDARLTVWALIRSENGEVNVTCTSQTGPVPEGESHVTGAVVGSVAAFLVLVAVVVILIFYFRKNKFRTTSRNLRGKKGNTTGNPSDDTTRGNEYAVVDLKDVRDMDDYLQRGQPVFVDSNTQEEDYDRLGQRRLPNNNEGEPNPYGHIRTSSSANGDSNYDHVNRGTKPGVVTEFYA